MKARSLHLAAALLVCSPLYGGAAENLALHKKVTLHTAPNYALSRDADDALQLTDGKRSENPGHMWAKKDSVTWQRRNVVVVSIDLESVQPIEKVRFSTASRKSVKMPWPSNLVVFVSQDGKEWELVGDIIHDAKADGVHPPESADGLTHVFESRPIRSLARFVAIAARGEPYLTCDEIEVIAASAVEPAERPTATGIEGVKNRFAELLTIQGIRERIAADRHALLERIAVMGERESELRDALNAIPAHQYTLGQQFGHDYRAIFPLNSEHRALFGIQAKLWREAGMTKPVVQSLYRYDWLAHIHAPAIKPAPAGVEMKLLGGERRGALLVVSNPTEYEIAIQATVSDSLGKAVSLHESFWTDTGARIAVSDVLLPVANGGSVSIPSGMSKKLWLAIDSESLPAGTVQGNVKLVGDGLDQEVPVVITVSPVKLQKAKLHLGLWDYLLSGPAYEITNRNWQAALAFCKENGVDTAWISRAGFPWPEAAWDEAAVKSQMQALARKVAAEWPEAARYAFFIHPGEKLGGEKLGTEACNARVASWLRALEGAFEEAGIAPERIVLQTVDEPYTEARAALSVAWAKAFRAAKPRARFFTNPVWKDFNTIPKEYMELADIVSPHIQLTRQTGQAAFDHFERLRNEGKQLEFYICAGPTRIADPVGYHRMASWFAYRHGAVGLTFWALGSIGGAPTSWNEYPARDRSYSPVFVGAETIDRTIHWEALAEGILDYSCFKMLEEAAAQNPSLQAKVEKLKQQIDEQLKRIPEGKGGDEIVNDFWYNAAPAEEVDRIRLEVVNLLEQVSNAYAKPTLWQKIRSFFSK